MPFAVAISAACLGSTAPALLAPSVNRMVNAPRRRPFSIRSVWLRRDRASERPSPMAVPSSISPTFKRLTWRCSQSWSEVSGASV
jgi:hypothetical protein